MLSEKKFILETDDQVILDLLPAYVNNRRLEIFKIKRFLAENEYDNIRRIGHNLAGSGSLYGLSPITELGKQLELLALAKDQENLQIIVKKLNSFLDRVEI